MGAQLEREAQTVSCLACHLDLPLVFDFMLGVSIIGALMWLLYWMEAASPAQVAEHFLGVGAVLFVLVLFTRFFMA